MSLCHYYLLLFACFYPPSGSFEHTTFMFLFLHSLTHSPFKCISVRKKQVLSNTIEKKIFFPIFFLLLSFFSLDPELKISWFSVEIETFLLLFPVKSNPSLKLLDRTTKINKTFPSFKTVRIKKKENSFEQLDREKVRQRSKPSEVS